MKFIFILLLTVTIPTWANSLSLKNYLTLQTALANDDFKESLVAFESICKNDLKDLKKNYTDCTKKFSDIEPLRESFKSLSKIYIENGDKKELGDLIIAECPMAKAQWIQKAGAIRNPYYGKSMLDCGSKVSK